MVSLCVFELLWLLLCVLCCATGISDWRRRYGKILMIPLYDHHRYHPFWMMVSVRYCEQRAFVSNHRRKVRLQKRLPRTSTREEINTMNDIRVNKTKSLFSSNGNANVFPYLILSGKKLTEGMDRLCYNKFW